MSNAALNVYEKDLFPSYCVRRCGADALRKLLFGDDVPQSLIDVFTYYQPENPSLCECL